MTRLKPPVTRCVCVKCVCVCVHHCAWAVARLMFREVERKGDE